MFTGPTRSATAPRSAAGEAAARREAIAALYAREGGRLRARVAEDLTGGRALAEDACQTAWLALLGRDDVALDAHGLAWLRTVAVTAGARLARGRDVAAQPIVDRHAEQAAGEGEPDQRAVELEELRERRARFVALPSRQRRLLGLQGLGFSYEEISALTGDSLRTVQRQLLRGRGQLGG
jgi:DNA-directed RNA polymerase specialized sigma24 family protein